MFQRSIIAHRVTNSAPQDSNDPQPAAKIGMEMLEKGRSALEAVDHAVRFLEYGPHFSV